MRPDFGLKNTRRLLASATALFFASTTLHATPVTGPWTLASGAATLSNTATSSPTWGDGTTHNATASALYSAFPLITLANTGDKLTMTGTADLLGISSGNLAFRFGIFNDNSSANATDWLGYFAGNAATQNGVLDVRTDPNTSLYSSTTGASTLASIDSTGSTSLTTASNPVTFSFTFTIERISASTLTISTSLFRPSDSAEFAGFSNIVDTNPTTFGFDRVGFQATSTLAADQIQFHSIDVAYTSAVPEPSTYATILSAVCFVGAAALRRNRA